MGNNQSQLNKSIDTAYISIDDEYNKNDDPEIRDQIKKIKSYQQKPPKKVVKKSKNPFNMLCCQQPKESQPWLEHFQEQCQQQSSEWTQAMIQLDFKRMNVYSDSYYQKNLQLLFYQNSDYNENSSISKYKVSIPNRKLLIAQYKKYIEKKYNHKPERN
ncbi:hypothetical protein PPERSA_04813 [Pseudocohnilembus persalinus]|uniref:Uncharacterized protein n=1 Tax=Pseudocohnilembus persalinus TaxID=266149 RepID=A0A0V0QLG6_PSEPJ|nr:hypothetical protein PPERSA_04813 [Pseudocohnilembus persalinus]|eukprot:KRX03018.1 hypothetical protein PPERSA_04813 [Pseudocohnilembus persalinus]